MMGQGDGYARNGYAGHGDDGWTQGKPPGNEGMPGMMPGTVGMGMMGGGRSLDQRMTEMEQKLDHDTSHLGGSNAMKD